MSVIPGKDPDPLWQAALKAHGRGDLDAALKAYRRYLEIRPEDARAWCNLGIALKTEGNLAEATGACRRAIGLDPRNANAFNNLGICLVAMNDIAAAIPNYRKALELDPRFHECWSNLGIALAAGGDPEAAVDAFRQALAINAGYTEAVVQLLYHSLQICAWDGLTDIIRHLSAIIRKDHGEVNPFSLLPVCTDAQEMRVAAQNYARRVEASVAHAKRPQRPETRRAGRPRIGYLSADFHAHATAYLTAELFESHDRQKFEIFAYSYGPADDGPMRQRLVAAFAHFTDIAAMSNEAAAQWIADDDLDLLIDLKGYTQLARPGILALRPAKLQAQYLGYPGTMGAHYIDHAIVDGFVVPPGEEIFWSERLVYLPGCYQPNDSRREIAEPMPSRAAGGLPEAATILCCFNQPYKIVPEMFLAWLGLMREFPETVLWLLAFNPTFGGRLKSIAAANGVDPERLILAPKLPLAQHLSRLRHADLFLDTFPCGAHTTASDALWAGVPVVTRVGATFASRVAGSLLHSIGLDPLVTTDLATYCETARQLLRNPAIRAAARQRIQAARTESDLFSGAAVARALEQVFMEILGRA